MRSYLRNFLLYIELVYINNYKEIIYGPNLGKPLLPDLISYS